MRQNLPRVRRDHHARQPGEHGVQVLEPTALSTQSGSQHRAIELRQVEPGAAVDGALGDPADRLRGGCDVGDATTSGGSRAAPATARTGRIRADCGANHYADRAHWTGSEVAASHLVEHHLGHRAATRGDRALHLRPLRIGGEGEHEDPAVMRHRFIENRCYRTESEVGIDSDRIDCERARGIEVRLCVGLRGRADVATLHIEHDEYAPVA